MSRYLAKLPTDRILRRRVTIGGKEFIVWFRHHPVRKPEGGCDWQPQMAVGRVGCRWSKLHWRPLAGVLLNAFAIDVADQQLSFEEVPHVSPS